MLKKKILLFSLMLVVLLVTACSGKTTAPASSGSPAAAQSSAPASNAPGGDAKNKLVFGVPISQTGAVAGLGVPGVKGMKHTVETINSKGGLKIGDKSYTIDLLFKDDASDPERNRAITEEMITKDKVDFMIGGVGTNVVASGLPIAERYKMPIVTTFAYGSKVLPQNPKYSYVNTLPIHMEFTGSLNFLKTKGAKKVVLVASNDPLGQGFVDNIPGIIKELGMELVSTERFNPKETNFAPILLKIKNTKPDVLLVEGQAADSYNFRRAEVEQGGVATYSVYEYGPNLWADWSKAAGDKGVGGIGPAMFWPTAKGYEDKFFGDGAGFVKSFKDKNGEEPDWSAAQGAQSIELMALALQAAGSLDKDKVVDAMQKLTGSTFFGPIKFDAAHYNVGFMNNEMLVQDQGGKAKIIYPDTLKEADIIPQPHLKK